MEAAASWVSRQGGEKRRERGNNWFRGLDWLQRVEAFLKKKNQIGQTLPGLPVSKAAHRWRTAEERSVADHPDGPVRLRGRIKVNRVSVRWARSGRWLRSVFGGTQGTWTGVGVPGV